MPPSTAVPVCSQATHLCQAPTAPAEDHRAKAGSLGGHLDFALWGEKGTNTYRRVRAQGSPRKGPGIGAAGSCCAGLGCQEPPEAGPQRRARGGAQSGRGHLAHRVQLWWQPDPWW